MINDVSAYGDKLFSHQKTAVDRYEDESVIPLFFDMGTGKSATALRIAAHKYDNGDIDALLIVAPNKIDKQWALEQIPLWLPDIDTTIYINKKSKKPIPFIANKLNIVCVNIDQFSTQQRYKLYVDWVNAHKTMIIVDEATKIKNPKAVRTQRLLYEFNDVVRRGRTIIASTPKTVARAILTGTPCTEGPFDVWSMFEFLQPNYFNVNYFAFQNRYGMFHAIEVNGRTIRILINQPTWEAIHNCPTFEQANMIHGVSLATYDYIRRQEHYDGPYRNVEELRQLMCKSAMFVRAQDVTDMPEQIYTRKMLDMSDEQARVYYEMENYLLSQYKDKEVSASSKLVSYIRLQQIASGFISSVPVELDENGNIINDDPKPAEVTWFDKKPKVDQLLIDMEEINEPVIIVCHFAAEAALLYEELNEAGYRCCLMTGWKTIGSVEGFKENKYDVMIGNVKVIGMGLNLQNSHRMIFYSNTFSLEDRLQVEARIWRVGQKEKCFYTDYVMTDTIDMKVFATLKQKRSLSDYIRDNSVEDMLTKVDSIVQEEYGTMIETATNKEVDYVF